jgi:hypothetical protein
VHRKEFYCVIMLALRSYMIAKDLLHAEINRLVLWHHAPCCFFMRAASLRTAGMWVLNRYSLQFMQLGSKLNTYPSPLCPAPVAPHSFLRFVSSKLHMHIDLIRRDPQKIKKYNYCGTGISCRESIYAYVR